MKFSRVQSCLGSSQKSFAHSERFESSQQRTSTQHSTKTTWISHFVSLTFRNNFWNSPSHLKSCFEKGPSFLCSKKIPRKLIYYHHNLLLELHRDRFSFLKSTARFQLWPTVTSLLKVKIACNSKFIIQFTFSHFAITPIHFSPSFEGKTLLSPNEIKSCTVNPLIVIKVFVRPRIDAECVRRRRRLKKSVEDDNDDGKRRRSSTKERICWL